MEFTPPNRKPVNWLWAIVALTLLAMLVPFIFIGRVVTSTQQMKYEVTASEVVIHFPADPVRIARSDITEAYVLRQPTGARRLNGTAMPGVNQGLWSFSETGRLRLYTTVLGDVVILRTTGQTWGITPADPQAFVQAVQSGQPGVWAPVPGPSPWSGLSMLGLLFLLLIPICGILLYYIRLPLSIRYVLDDQALRIRGGRVRIDLPYASITGAEVTSPKGWPLRSIGAAMPGLYWGRFSWKAAGGKVMLYATRYKPLVLVTANGTTYGITPAEEDRFMDELTKRMGRP